MCFENKRDLSRHRILREEVSLSETKNKTARDCRRYGVPHYRDRRIYAI